MLSSLGMVLRGGGWRKVCFVVVVAADDDDDDVVVDIVLEILYDRVNIYSESIEQEINASSF